MRKIMKNGKINGLLDVYGIIYLVKNKVNGKCYVGQTVKKNGFNDRYGVGNGRTMIESFYKARKQNNDLSDIVLEDMEKYGLDSFEINECIDYAFSKTELDVKEKTYISIYQSMINNNYNNCNSNSNNNLIDKITNGIFIINPYNNCYIGGYNKTSGGAGVKDYKWPEESKQKLKEIKNTPEAIERAREAAKKENLSPETLKKRSESLKGHYISDDTKLLISDNIEKMWKDGKYSSEEVKKNMSEGQKRRWEDEDNKIKASEISKKKWEDEEYRKNVVNGVKKAYKNQALRNHLSEAGKGAKNSQAKAVVCMTGIKNKYSQKIFSYIGAAKKWMRENELIGANSSGISRCCRGLQEFQGYGIDGEKLEWKYLKDLNKEELKELLNKDLANDEKEIVQKQISKN